MFKELDELCSITENYFPYKKHLITQTPPLIPYLGVFLRDLTSLEVGNPSYLDEDGTIVNFNKYRMIAKTLQDFQKYQQVLYNFTPHKQIQTAFRFSLITKDEKELFNLSRELEPNLKGTRS